MAYQVLVTTYADSKVGDGAAVATIVIDFSLRADADIAIKNINGQQYIPYAQRAVALY